MESKREAREDDKTEEEDKVKAAEEAKKAIKAAMEKKKKEKAALEARIKALKASVTTQEKAVNLAKVIDIDVKKCSLILVNIFFRFE